MPLNSELGHASLGMRQFASLGALLSHALASWLEHSEFALSESMAENLQKRDLYARLSVKALQPQQQSDLLSWAEAHTVLAFIARGDLLERFASHAPESWEALCSLGGVARKCGCADEGRYALITDCEKLRALVAETAPTAARLLRLLPWCANPLQGGNECRGSRQRTSVHDDEDPDRLRTVKVKFAGGQWSRDIDWEELALVREPSPGREKGSSYPAPMVPW